MLKKMVEILRMWLRKERVSAVENVVVETPPEVVRSSGSVASLPIRMALFIIAYLPIFSKRSGFYCRCINKDCLYLQWVAHRDCHTIQRANWIPLPLFSPHPNLPHYSHLSVPVPFPPCLLHRLQSSYVHQ
mgnify:CR=1 FL=1